MATIPEPQNEEEKKLFQQEMDPSEKFLRNLYFAYIEIQKVQNDIKTKEQAIQDFKGKFLY